MMDWFQDRNLFYVSFGGCKHGTSQCLFGQPLVSLDKALLGPYFLRGVALGGGTLGSHDKHFLFNLETQLETPLSHCQKQRAYSPLKSLDCKKKDAGWYRKGQETPKKHQCCFFIWELDHNFRKLYILWCLLGKKQNIIWMSPTI